MKINLLSIATLSVFSLLLVGCGSSDDGKTTTPTATPTKTCTFPAAAINGSLSAEGSFTPNLEVKSSKGAVLTDVVVTSTPTLDANNTIQKAGTYSIVLTSPSCDNKGTVSVVVSEYVDTNASDHNTSGYNTVTKTNILPF